MPSNTYKYDVHFSICTCVCVGGSVFFNTMSINTSWGPLGNGYWPVNADDNHKVGFCVSTCRVQDAALPHTNLVPLRRFCKPPTLNLHLGQSALAGVPLC